jgi:hypothetical protein
MRSVDCANWRTFTGELKEVAKRLQKTIWEMMRWSRGFGRDTQTTPHMLALRKTAQQEPIDKDEGKAALLTEKFFPPRGDADLSDIHSEPWRNDGEETLEHRHNSNTYD